MLNTVAMADDYFSTNYYGAEAWASLSETQKEMLIETAEIDVSMALNSDLDPDLVVHTEKPYTPVQMAVFEWALYIHTNKAKLAKKLNSTNTGLASIEVDGVGKETYSTSHSHGSAYLNCLWGSRAGQFLALVERDVRIIR
jgi:hypothetical protein